MNKVGFIVAWIMGVSFSVGTYAVPGFGSGVKVSKKASHEVDRAVTQLPDSVLAGRSGSHGGDVVILQGQYYLLDLVEAGVHTHPYFDWEVKPDSEIQARVDQALANAPGAPIELIARKLGEIHQKNPAAALGILHAMEFYSWRIVVPELIELNDEKETILKIKTFKQLAIRKGTSITVNAELWNKLDENNKAALIFHEVFSALVGGVIFADIPDVFAAESFLARTIVGVLFSKEFKYKGLTQFEADLGFRIRPNIKAATSVFVKDKHYGDRSGILYVASDLLRVKLQPREEAHGPLPRFEWLIDQAFNSTFDEKIHQMCQNYGLWNKVNLFLPVREEYFLTVEFREVQYFFLGKRSYPHTMAYKVSEYSESFKEMQERFKLQSRSVYLHYKVGEGRDEKRKEYYLGVFQNKPHIQKCEEDLKRAILSLQQNPVGVE